MSDATDEKTLRRSTHISLFHRDGALYVYHDLMGYVLEMDQSVFALLQAFGREGRVARDVIAESELVTAEAQGFVDVFQQHFCLVEPDSDELLQIDSLYPVWAPWAIHYSPGEDDVELGIKDRCEKTIGFKRLNRLEGRLWNMCFGQKTVADIAASLSESLMAEEGRDYLEIVRQKVAAWTHSRLQLLKLVSTPVESPSELPPYVRSAMPYDRVEDESKLSELLKPLDKVVDVRDYHRQTIDDASEQFEVKETTLSHMFRNPHPALGDDTFGGRFARQLVERGLLGENCRVVEVGGGAGWFARRLIEGLRERHPDVERSLDYSILELSPALAASQQKIAAEATGGKVKLVFGDALEMPFADGSLDLLISNEMIGDLPSARVKKNAEGAFVDADGSPGGAGPAAIAEFGLSCGSAGEDFWLNTGAYDFLREIRRVLKPGGAAVLTEFGEKWAYPIPSTHLDHREFSIHFGHLTTVAEALGFEAEVLTVLRLLRFDRDCLVLSTTKTSFQLLRELFRTRKVSFEKIAYTQPMFEELCAEAGLDPRWILPLEWKPLGKRVLGLKPKEFKALIVTPIRGKRRKRALDL